MAQQPPKETGATAGTVWNVLSGDTVEVILGMNGKIPNLKKVTLVGVQAPRLGMRGQMNTQDEPFAWEAKEYARKNLLNKKVQFRAIYASGDREFCDVRFEGDKQSLSVKLLAAGCAKLSANQQAKALAFYGELEAAEVSAKGSGLGVWSSAPKVRELVSTADAGFDIQSWFDEVKQKRRTCVVEFVRDAGSYRIVIVPEVGAADQRYVSTQLLLSGVQLPGFKRGPAGEEESQPGAFQAKHWVSMRVLSREMVVHLESIQKVGGPGAQQTQFMGSLIHPAKGNIAEFLLEEGFGLYVDWSAQKAAGGGAEALQKAQKKAQEKKSGRWKNWDGKSGSTERFEFNGKVTEVCSGDVLKIQNLDQAAARAPKELRYYLASVRAPAVQRNNAGGWGPIALEYMRSRLIGRTVTVKLEYKKNIEIFTAAGGASPPPSDETTGDMYFVSVYLEKENVALDAIKAGMVTVQRQGDMNDRSPHFDEMAQLDEAAAQAKVGVHAGADKAPTPTVYTELVLQNASFSDNSKKKGPTTRKELSERVKAFEAQLCAKKAGHDGMVTYIMNGSRCRVKLPHEKLLVTFQMNGVKAPNPDRPMPAGKGSSMPGMKAEPFGDESLAFSRSQIMQQDVKVIIERVDPKGAFVGAIFTTDKQGRKKDDLALLGLKKGLLWCDEWCANNAYWSAESAAKKENLGYWSAIDGAEEVDVVEVKVAAGTPIRGEITQVNALDSFYVVPAGAATKIQQDVAAQQSKFEDCFKDADLNRKQMYVAQYWEDKKFYRARFNGKGTEGKYSMFFIDFGYKVDCDLVKKVPAGNPLGSLPSAAMHCALYGVKTSDEWWESACEAFFKMTDGKVVEGSIEKAENGVQKCVLRAAGVCVNLQLVKDALARLTRKEKTPTSVNYADWTNAQTTARRARAKIWRYGDIDSDEEEY